MVTGAKSGEPPTTADARGVHAATAAGTPKPQTSTAARLSAGARRGCRVHGAQWFYRGATCILGILNYIFTIFHVMFSRLKMGQDSLLNMFQSSRGLHLVKISNI